MLPSQKDMLTYQRLFLDSVNRGIADVEAGNIYTTDELKVELEKRRLMRLSESKKIAQK